MHLQSKGDTSVFDNIDIILMQSSYFELSIAFFPYEKYI